MKDPKKYSLLGLLLGAVGLLASPVVHAQINTGIEYGSATGLGSEDIRTTIARIIQVFLGILGIIALVLVIYAGFLWMTAGGDEEKVARAKKILSQAVIGLIIILASFAITSFVVSKLVEATGEPGEPGGGPGGPGGPLPSVQFAVESITPPDSKDDSFLWPKNSQVRVILRNGVPDPATVSGSVAVSTGGIPVSGTIEASGNVLIFKATAVCVENPSYTCLQGNSTFTVTVAPTLKSATGKDLFCGKCSATFSTNDIVDAAPPSVSVVSPSDGQSVSVASFVPVIADAHDDSAVAAVEFFANGVSLGSAGSEPWQIDWDTTGIPEGTAVPLRATATDVVGNTTMSSTITVSVRPAHCFNNVVDGGETGLNCGDGCGDCGSGSCTENSQCASGLCVDGRCVNRPRIDSVDPLSGGPGTLVSIKGASFGNAAGEVMFLGTAASGDEMVAAPCAPSAWTDTQVIVGVPEGAVSGPLQLTNTDNYSDRTDDDFGNVSIPDFTVNTTVRPGICLLTPDTGPTGTSVEVSGNGFGDAQAGGSVVIAGRPANIQSWSGTTITMTTPNLLGGVWPVMVTASSNNSNRAAFYVPVAGNTGPHLLSVEPDSGPVGEYITISGSNFGGTPGKIQFTNGADTVLGGIDFPPACDNDFWHETYVTVKVPAGLPEDIASIKLVRADAVASDNTLDFDIVPGTPSAGICRISPSTGPVGTVYTLDGERLGAERGKVIFRNDVDATSALSSWNDSRISGFVPATAATGGVYAISAGANRSNSLNFNVADCRQAQVCSGSEECCEDGTCRGPNADGSSGCFVPRLDGSFIYRFSTGDIPLTPRVVEEESCTVRTQSPSPYKGHTDACINSVASVRFNIPMDATTLNASNFKLLDCGSGVAYDPAACQDAVAGAVASFGGAQTLDDGLEFAPTGGFKANTWYQGTVSRAVRSLGGVNMDEDYVWNFRIRDSVLPCDIASVTVAPANNLLTDLYTEETRGISENISYTGYKANPANEKCYLLDCEQYAWNWGTDQNTAVGIEDPLICRTEVRALAQTAGPVPAEISATAQERTGTGDITIKFAAPRLIDKWPACDAACLNAQIAAAFNVAVKDVSSRTVKLFKCQNESCNFYTEVAGYSVETLNNGTEHLAIINLSDGSTLEANTYYRVMVFGGDAGVHSLSGANLQVGGTYVYGAERTPVETWKFATTDKRCVVDRVNMSPLRINTSIVGSYHSVTAEPISAPDSCSDKGQRLETNSLNLSWGIDPASPGAADLYAGGRLNVSPLASSYSTSSCLNTGTIAGKPVCGNAKVEYGNGVAKPSGREAEGGGEECDLGTNADGSTLNGAKDSGCSANCLLTGGIDNRCGDGTRDTYTLGDNRSVATEQCDDGNLIDGDGCSSKCLREGSSSGSNPSICGNGSVGDNEQCDDSNNAGGDGCSAECLDEGSLPGPFSVCGNALLEAGEDCDLGSEQNGKAGSGCSASCQFTGTAVCTAAGQANCCGNGTRDAGEAPGCDGDWNAANGMPNKVVGCNNTCRKTGSSFSFAPPSVCGDAAVGIGEGFTGPGGAAADPGALGSQTDPTQYAHAVGAGNVLDADGKMITMISATVDGKSGQTEFVLECGFTSDDGSTAHNCPAGTYLGSNSCCYERARVVNTTPSGANICRNTVIEAEFDQEMDLGTLTAATFTLTAPVGGCPAVASAPEKPVRGFWSIVKSFFAKVIAFVFGRSAIAQSATCTVSGTVSADVRTMDDGTKHTFARFELGVALAARTTYTATIDKAVKTANGVSMGAATSWSFITGSDICTLDALNVTPPSILFTAKYVNGIDDPNAESTFVGQAVHNASNGEAESIAPIPNVYAWQVDWASSDPTLLNSISNNIMNSAPADGSPVIAIDSGTIKAGVAKAENGQVALTASAKVTADAVNPTSTIGNVVSGISDVTVMLCNDPWPARTTTSVWAPAQNDIYNYSFYYCKDVGLPALEEEPGSPAKLYASLLSDYLYTYTDPAHASEGIGIRVAKNPLHLSPTAWYISQGFKNSVTSLKVDGYEAIQDGRTVYVNAPALDVAGVDYTNIYILSYTAGAGTDTQNIFGQILKNFRFAANRDSLGRLLYNDQNLCQDKATASCASDLDCPSGVCLVDRSKVRRDVKRLSDLFLIAEAVQRSKDTTGSYPNMASGSFVAGQTVSTWPSWSKEFATEIGGGPPVDPVNKLAECDDYSTDGTCWSPSKQAAICPAGSYVYRYMYPNNGEFYNLNLESSASFEFNCDKNGITQSECNNDPTCFYDASYSSHPCRPRFGVNYCNGQTISSSGAVCGNGVIENSEQCEKAVAPTQTISCGSNGTQVDTCGANCQWVTGSCQAAKCGNGVKEANEVCDQGALNGTYGHCNAACSGIGQSCGDGIIQQGEACDDGANNGRYGYCAFDCYGRAPYCGDKIVNGSEQCDGSSLTSNDPAVTGLSLCPDAIGTDGNTHPQTRINTCTDCGLGGWGQCVPVGSCGDGNTDGSEQCDNGSANSDTGPCTTACRLNACGDGKVNIGVEQCDAGGDNINPNTAEGQAIIAQKREDCSLASCYYCSTSCLTKAVSGGYCGDEIVNEATGEECEMVTPPRSESCTTVDGYAGNKSQGCTESCKWGPFGICTPSDYCGDGAINGPEICDMGTASNDGAPGHCKSDCSGQICALTDTFVVSNVRDTLVSVYPDMSGAVNSTDVKTTYNGGGYDVVGEASYVWSATYAPTNDVNNPEKKYFRHNFSFNCEVATGTKFILHMNVDDEVNVAVNGHIIPPIDNDRNVTMSNLSSPGYKYSKIYDVTPWINLGGINNVLDFTAHNIYGPAFLAYWLETSR